MDFVDYSLIFLCVTPLFILGCYAFIFYKKGRKLELLLVIATILHETLLVSLPGFLDVFNHYELEKALRFETSSYDLIKVMLIENLYIFIFFLPFLLFISKKLPPAPITKLKVYNFLALITSIGVIVYVYQLLHRPTIQDIVDSYSQSGLEAGSNPLISLFNIVFEYAAIIGAAILVIKGKHETYPVYYQWIGALMLTLCLALVMISGVRGRVVWVVEFTLLVAVIKRRLKPIFYMALLVIIFIPINNVLVTQIRPISEEIAKEGGVTNEALKNIFFTIVKGFQEPSKDSPSILNSLDERAQGPRNSVILLKEYDRGKNQSATIYLGALFYPIPRNIINRPVIGSPNLDFQNAGIFKVMDLNYPQNTFINMGPLLASAHAYWEGGYLGVIVIAILSSLLWILIIRCSYQLPFLMGVIVCLIMGCSLLIDGFISFFTPLYAEIATIWKAILPLVLCFYIYNKVRIPKFSLRS